MPKKEFYNHMDYRTEVVKLMTCPVCRSSGLYYATHSDVERCYLCNGWGEVWRNNSTGFTVAKYGKPGTGEYY